MKNKILVLSLMMTLVGCASNINSEPIKNANMTANALNKQALLELLSGSTVYQDNNDFVQVGFYSKDNTMTGNIWGSWEDHVDKGNWLVNDEDQFCNQWTGLWSKNDGQSCYKVYSGDADGQYLMVPNSGGKDMFQVMITPQNTDEFE